MQEQENPQAPEVSPEELLAQEIMAVKVVGLSMDTQNAAMKSNQGHLDFFNGVPAVTKYYNAVGEAFSKGMFRDRSVNMNQVAVFNGALERATIVTNAAPEHPTKKHLLGLYRTYKDEMAKAPAFKHVFNEYDAASREIREGSVADRYNDYAARLKFIIEIIDTPPTEPTETPTEKPTPLFFNAKDKANQAVERIMAPEGKNDKEKARNKAINIGNMKEELSKMVRHAKGLSPENLELLNTLRRDLSLEETMRKQIQESINLEEELKKLQGMGQIPDDVLKQAYAAVDPQLQRQQVMAADSSYNSPLPNLGGPRSRA